MEKNPYAICTVSISQTEGTPKRSTWSKNSLDKYERCVLSVKKKMEHGGTVVGPSHENGGVGFSGDDGTNIELEGNEFVIPYDVLNSEKTIHVKGTVKEILDQISEATGIPSTTDHVSEIVEGDAVICKNAFQDHHQYEFEGTIPEILTKIQEIHGCNPIEEQSKSDNEREEFEKMQHGGIIHVAQPPLPFKQGGTVFEFDKNDIPNKRMYHLALYIKNKYPEVWSIGGNEFGNTAFRNLEKVIKRGHWLDDERWMYMKWKSFMARHVHNVNPKGIVAMLKWLGKVERGTDYMKAQIRDEVARKYPDHKYDSKLYREGGNIDQLSGGLSDNKSLSDIAKHHEVPLSVLNKEFRKGLKVEREHTSDENKAAEIARDHLMENPEYYTSLQTIEGDDEIIMGLNISEISTYKHKNKIEFFMTVDIINDLVLGFSRPLPSDLTVHVESLEEDGLMYPITVNYSIGQEKLWLDNDNMHILLACRIARINVIPVIVKSTHSAPSKYSIPTLPIRTTSNGTNYFTPATAGLLGGKSYNSFMFSIEKMRI